VTPASTIKVLFAGTVKGVITSAIAGCCLAPVLCNCSIHLGHLLLPYSQTSPRKHNCLRTKTARSRSFPSPPGSLGSGAPMGRTCGGIIWINVHSIGPHTIFGCVHDCAQPVGNAGSVTVLEVSGGRTRVPPGCVVVTCVFALRITRGCRVGANGFHVGGVRGLDVDRFIVVSRRGRTCSSVHITILN